MALMYCSFYNIFRNFHWFFIVFRFSALPTLCMLPPFLLSFRNSVAMRTININWSMSFSAVLLFDFTTLKEERTTFSSSKKRSLAVYWERGSSSQNRSDKESRRKAQGVESVHWVNLNPGQKRRRSTSLKLIKSVWFSELFKQSLFLWW